MLPGVLRHGYPRAKASLYQPGVRVPLLVRWLGRVRPGAVNDDLVSTVDLSATFLAAAGTGELEAAEGQSLENALAGGAHARQYVFTERNWHDTWDPMRGAVTKRYSLICNYRPEISYRGTLDHVSAPWSRGGGPAWDAMEAARKSGSLAPALQGLFQQPRPLVELYDLEKDPNEFQNRAGLPEMQTTLQGMYRALSRWM